MDKIERFLKQAILDIKGNKDLIKEIITPYTSAINLNLKPGKRKRKELIDLIKFIVSSNQSIKILSNQAEEPDFLVSWDGEDFGLEHVEVIDEDKKREFEKNEWYVKQIERHFLANYGNIERHIRLSLKADIIEISEKEKKNLINNLQLRYKGLEIGIEVLFKIAYPGKVLRIEIPDLVKSISDKIYDAFINNYERIDDPLINYISFQKSRKTSLGRNYGYSAGSLSEIILKDLAKKEENLDRYLSNTNGIRQCLFMVIQGSSGYSDYSYFDENILHDRITKFDKVIAFNFFTTETFYLK